MTAQAESILFPVGRAVQGSFYTPYTKDQQGNPLTIKTGPNIGKPTQKYFFAVAIHKNPGEQHWASTAWGAKIWALGNTSWPQGQAGAPTFAWKIEDGDSQIPNKVGKRNCDREGFPGSWIVEFSSSFAPKIVNSAGDLILEPNAIKLGFWVEVLGSVLSNENPGNPGVYVNHSFVALRGYGDEIHAGPVGPDPRTLGFGKSVLPPGASAVPTGGAAFPASLPPPAAAFAPPPPVAAPVTPVVPAPAFIAPPPPAPAAPPAAVGPQMTAKATASYAAYVSGGWTDALLRQHGLMV